MHYLRQQCAAHGCHTLNQLQLLLRVGKADTVLELLLARLDEQGSLRPLASGKLATRRALLAPSGPGFIKPGWRTSDVLAAQKSSKRYERRGQAHLCSKACGKLGGSQPAILFPVQLRGSHTWWMHLEELRSRQC